MDKILSHQEWTELAERHRKQVEELAAPWKNAKDRKAKHPVIDFLFQYYSFPYNRLLAWTPGIGVKLETPIENLSKERFETVNDYVELRKDKFPHHRWKAVDWTLSLLIKTAENQACFNCYGLHEWAMVYKADKIRHEYETLRLSEVHINEIVEEKPLNCTHYDALRFYTPEALPMNKFSPSRETQEDYEQSGCLHANMDLYKWAYKMYPWINSKLLLKCFKLAFACREVDMKASPYDLLHLGYEPIKIETPEGREEYVREQNRLKKMAEPVRAELIEAYRSIKAKIES